MSQVVLITGTSSAFGLAAALQLARRGHHVFATMRNAQGRVPELAGAPHATAAS